MSEPNRLLAQIVSNRFTFYVTADEIVPLADLVKRGYVTVWGERDGLYASATTVGVTRALRLKLVAKSDDGRDWVMTPPRQMARAV